MPKDRGADGRRKPSVAYHVREQPGSTTWGARMTPENFQHTGTYLTPLRSAAVTLQHGFEHPQYEGSDGPYGTNGSEPAEGQLFQHHQPVIRASAESESMVQSLQSMVGLATQRAASQGVSRTVPMSSNAGHAAWYGAARFGKQFDVQGI